MEERLVVKNFGPIKDVDIRIGKLTVLIGEQATGKSTLSKLLHLFSDRDFLFNLSDNYMSLMNKYEFPFEAGTQIDYNSSDFSISCRPGDFKVFHQGKDVIPLNRFYSLYRRLLSGLSTLEREELSILSDWYLRRIGTAVYVPAERIYINHLNDTRTLLDGNYLMRDYFLELNAQRKMAKELSIPHLDDVSYTYANGNEVVRIGDTSISLSNASSGFQASIPLVVLLNGYAQSPFKNKIIIEEPELNLFPTTQHRLMQYLVSNLNKTENQILITTHSPYILAALNNMLNAYKSGQIDKERTQAILPADYWLNADEVTAYRLMPDGTAKDLMNREFSMIHSEEIDQVSGTLNQQFDDLVDIQLEAENG